MSVLARKRKLSELKFYDNAIRLRRSMIYLLMRDLGAKRGVRDIKWMIKDIPPQDAELLLAVAERNGLKRFETDWSQLERWSMPILHGNTYPGAATKSGTMRIGRSGTWTISTGG